MYLSVLSPNALPPWAKGCHVLVTWLPNPIFLTNFWGPLPAQLAGWVLWKHMLGWFWCAGYFFRDEQPWKCESRSKTGKRDGKLGGRSSKPWLTPQVWSPSELSHIWLKWPRVQFPASFSYWVRAASGRACSWARSSFATESILESENFGNNSFLKRGCGQCISTAHTMKEANSDRLLLTHR